MTKLPIATNRGILEFEPSEVAAPTDDPNDPYWQAAYSEALKVDLCLFAKAVLGIEVGPHMRSWGDLVQNYRRIAINAARDHSKCVTGDTLILATDGRLVRADEWQGGDVFAFNPETQTFEAATSTPSFENGVERALRITTRTGRSVSVTENHPLLKFSGWARADSLTAGDRIAVPYRLAVASTKEEPLAWLMGLLIGDGSLGDGEPIFTKKDPLVIEAARTEGAKMGWGLVGPRSNFSYRFHKNGSHDGPVKWLKDAGLAGLKSKDKHVPASVMAASDASVTEFLAGYFDADGCVNMHGGGSLSYSSTAKPLLQQVQFLMTRMGVLSVLTMSTVQYKGADYPYWNLAIRGKDILTFADRIPLRGKRVEELAKLVELQKTRGPSSGRTVDAFPAEVWEHVEHPKNWFAKNGFPKPEKGYSPTREKVKAVAEAENNEKLRRFADAPVLWDEIVEIEDIGERMTYCVSVPGLENYVAGNVINHNSTFFSYAYPIWRAWSEPGCEVYLFSNTVEQASEFLDIIVYGRNNLKGLVDIEALANLVPSQDGFRMDPRLRLNRTDLRMTNGSRIRTVGYSKAVRGRHPRYIVLDDVLNDEDMFSETVRHKNIEYFRSAIVNMATPDAQVLVVGTPYHSNDLYGELRKNPVYAFARYPGIFKTKDGEERALFPWRWSLEALKAKREEIGAVAFTREIECLPISDSMSIFPRALFPILYDDTLTLRPSKEDIAARGLSVFMGVDIARSANVGADFFVVFVVGADRQGNHYILDIRRTKGLAFTDQLKEIGMAAELYDPDLIFIESNAMQQIYTDEMRRMTDLPVKEFVTHATNKYPLDRGVPGLRILLENKKFIIPRGDAYSVQMTDIWIDEATSFGFVDGRLQGIGAHDDTVMAWWMACEAKKAGGFSFGFGDDDGADAPEDEVIEGEGRWEDVLYGDPTDASDVPF